MMTEETARFNYEAVETVSFSINYGSLMGSCTAPAVGWEKKFR